MRNLKKILALVLALVMSLSLMATAGAASFQDVTDDNPYKTAIDVLDQLKVFQGFEDGSFKPTDTLNRAQAAVLVYRIATGDVEGKQVENYTYMAQSKFVDLDGYNWAKGYINYCQNAKIVVGTDATHFNPGGQVTGYQLMVMLLRTLGYGAAGEFSDPKGWELETAKIAEREGILKNVTGGDFGAAAPRQMVAEILFRGLLSETVEYSALTPGGYTKTGETLGKRELGLEEIEGVVLANDFADLRDDSVLKGKTALDVDGETYTLDYASDVDDLGESRLAYIQNGTKVLKLDDTGKNVTNESTKNEKIDDILSGASISKGSADEYINFGKGFNWKSDWRIKYVIDLGDTNWTNTTIVPANGDIDTLTTMIEDGRDDGYKLPDITYSGSALTGNYSLVKNDQNTYNLVYTRVFAIGDDIGADDRTNIYNIFDIADKIGDNYIRGEVYAGTTSKTDLSDEMTYKAFVEKYVTSDRLDPISRNDNGNWVKVIDNDADGVADYIFKVYYTVAQVSRVKDDKVTLDVNKETLGCSINSTTHNYNPVNGETVICADTLDEGDIVYYALIDGQIQAYKMEPETATIDKVNRNTKTATTTDAAEYVESEICMEIRNDEYQTGVRNLAGKVSYDLYRDRGGFLAVFTKTNTTGNFKLVTNAWFNSTKTGYEYAIKAYNDETKEQDTVDVTENGSKFISGNVVNDTNRVQNNDWNALKYLGGVSGNNALINNIGALNGSTRTTMYRDEEVIDNRIKTTVVAMGDDGLIMPVDNASVSSRRTHRIIDIEPDARGNYTIPGRDYMKGVAYTTTRGANTAYDVYDGTDEADATVEVRALSTTTYYFVYPTFNAANDVGVVAYTGYGDVPSLSAEMKNAIEDIYVVGTQTDRVSTNPGDDRTSSYYTADVVVVEFNEDYLYDTELVFLVDAYEVHNNVSYDTATVIFASNGESKDIELDTSGWHGEAGDRPLRPGPKIVRKVSENTYDLVKNVSKNELNNYKWFAGQISTALGTREKDYFELRTFSDDSATVLTISGGDYEEFRLTDSSKVYTLSYEPETANAAYSKQRATLTLAEDQHDLEDTLAERMDRSRTMFDKSFVYDDEDNAADAGYKYGNRNDVLVYAKSNGDVIFAVSFANIDTTKRMTNCRNYAQTVWQNVIPGPKDAADDAIVEFYGVRDGEDLDLAAATKTIKVTYGQTALAIDALHVENAESYRVTASDSYESPKVDLEDPREVTPPTDADTTYYLWTTDGNGTVTKWTLVIALPVADALEVVPGAESVVEILPDGRWNVKSPATTWLGTFLNSIRNANLDGDIYWEATDRGGVPVEESDLWTTHVSECESLKIWLVDEDGDIAGECRGTIDYVTITWDPAEATVAPAAGENGVDCSGGGVQRWMFAKGATMNVTALGDPVTVNGDEVTNPVTLNEDVVVAVRGLTAAEQKAKDEADIAAAKQLIDALTMPTDAAEDGSNAVFTENTLKALLANMVNTGLAAGAAAGDEPAAFPTTVEVTADDITITDPANLDDIATWAAGVEKTIKFTVNIDVKAETSEADPETSTVFTVKVVWYKSASDIKTAVKAKMPTTCNTSSTTSFDDFKTSVEAIDLDEAGITNFQVTSSAPGTWGAGSYTLEYSFDYAGEENTLTDSVSVTLS